MNTTECLTEILRLHDEIRDAQQLEATAFADWMEQRKRSLSRTNLALSKLSSLAAIFRDQQAK